MCDAVHIAVEGGSPVGQILFHILKMLTHFANCHAHFWVEGDLYEGKVRHESIQCWSFLRLTSCRGARIQALPEGSIQLRNEICLQTKRSWWGSSGLNPRRTGPSQNNEWAIGWSTWCCPWRFPFYVIDRLTWVCRKSFTALSVDRMSKVWDVEKPADIPKPTDFKVNSRGADHPPPTCTRSVLLSACRWVRRVCLVPLWISKVRQASGTQVMEQLGSQSSKL